MGTVRSQETTFLRKSLGKEGAIGKVAGQRPVGGKMVLRGYRLLEATDGELGPILLCSPGLPSKDPTIQPGFGQEKFGKIVSASAG